MSSMSGGGFAVAVVVMGVCGSGKSSVGRTLAAKLGVPFVEGDDYHSPANIEKMTRGVPLADEDRQAWITAVAERIRELSSGAEGESAVGEECRQRVLWRAVVSCSALKRAYRDTLCSSSGTALLFVHLVVNEGELRLRMERRQGHFMPMSLLQSQLASMEPPTPLDEDALRARKWSTGDGAVTITTGDASSDELVEEIVARIRALECRA